MPPRASSRYPRELGPITFGPITGVTDSEQPAAAKQNRARRLTNCYVPGGTAGLPTTGFPGFTPIGSALGAGGARAAQYIGQLRKLDGSRITVAIVGGKFYTLNWSTRIWTETLTAGNLAGASVTLSSTARVYGVEFASGADVKLVISDGINTPWMWDGTAGAGITKLTNAPIFYGAPWVYYAKLFGIKAAERNTFVWSEEADATTGYEAGGFNNAWNPLGATALHAGCADNAGMYLFEEGRTIKIEGAVDTAFSTSGTRSAVSETIGSVSSPLVTNAGIVFVDAVARPHLLIGGTVVPAWADCEQTVRGTSRDTLTAAYVLEYPPADMVLIGLAEVNQDAPTQFLALRVSDGQANFVGVRRGFRAQAAAVVLNDAGERVWIHAGEDDGVMYEHGNPGGVLWDDELTAGTQPIAHEVILPPIGTDVKRDQLFDRLDAVVVAESSASCSIAYTTPRRKSADLTTVFPAITGMVWDQDNWDAADWAGVVLEQRVAVGLDAFGRWIAPEVRHSAIGEQFGFTALEVERFELGTDPEIP
jgi:hypothetical protein